MSYYFIVEQKFGNRLTIQPDEAIRNYRLYLTSIYDTRSLPVDDKYPLECVKHFVNLVCADVSKHLSRKKSKSLGHIVEGKLDSFPRERITMNHADSFQSRGQIPKTSVD